MTEFHVGTSGWHYKHWSGDFYPAALPTDQWLSYYVKHFDTVELNNSFYHLPKESSWRKWQALTPRGFCFSVKASRYITHLKQLDVGPESIDRFFGGAKLLGDRLGPVLYQLPPRFARSEETVQRLEAFARQLPRGVEHVVEFRHPSWFVDATFDEMRRAGLGFCAYHMPDFETPLRATTATGYLRFHGASQKYGGAYGESTLEGWAERLRGLDAERVFVYFNNDIGGHAPRDAAILKRLLDGPS